MRKYLFENYQILLLGLLFFILYSTLSVIRHEHFMSAYDLSVVDQIMWKYSRFIKPITTVHVFSGTLIFTDHIEFIYAVLSPLYWIWNDAKALIIAQSFFIAFSAIPIYLFAIKRNLSKFLALSISLTFLLFYGIQTAIWNDVHSIVFGAAFLPWFIYFLEIKNNRFALISFFLTIICKEDVAFLIFFISLTYFIIQKRKIEVLFMMISAAYLFSIFFIYYPHFTYGYRFQSSDGFFGNLSLGNYFNTIDKKQTIIYSMSAFGFLPILAPLYLIPAFADISHYFILGSSVTTAQGIFLHYRVTLASLMSIPTIITISKYKKLNKWYTGIYLIFFALAITYQLHLPLTYLTKSWFWKTPPSINSINQAIQILPKDASVVSEVNITPHIDHRKNIYTLFADTKEFKQNSPCGNPSCPWLHWSGSPQYLIADTSEDWDIRQLFQNNPDFNSALSSMEKFGVIKKYKQVGSTKIYLVLKNPNL